ncbi:MAG: DUF4349 domain-containing protein [Acidimicrobiales bacterium]
MTEYDEEKLRRALRDAADGFAISDGATERILDAARDSGDAEAPSRIRSFVGHTGRMRSTVMAAAACVVVLAVAVPLFNSEVTRKTPITIQGSAFTPGASNTNKSVSGQVAPLGLAINGTGQVATTGTSTDLSYSALKTASKSTSKSSGSSLRVEEIGTIYLTVGGTRFESTLSQLTDFATTDGGFVASTQSHMGTKATHTYSTGSIVLEVPEHNFTMLVDQVRHAGVATSVMTSANDVTGQYVDLQARISALQLSRAQYLKIMSRTNSIGGILSIQDQLNSIQSQIEQLQAQLALLNSETTYATLTVSLSVAGHQVNPPVHPLKGVDKAWHESLHGFAAGFEWLIRIAGPLLFALLVLAALLGLGRLTWRATERRRSRIS